MDYTPDDEAKYLGVGGGGGGGSVGFFGGARRSAATPPKHYFAEAPASPPPPPQQKQRNKKPAAIVEEEDDEEEELDDEYTFKRPTKRKPQQQQREGGTPYPVPPPLRKSQLREEDDADNKIEPEPEEFQGMEFQVPVRRARTTAGGAPVPVRVQKAAETLLGYSELKRNVKQEMQILFDRPDDSAIIDPLIVISKTVSTGTCSIFLEEEVPVSQLLLARVLNARFVVQVTQKASMPPENFEEVAVKASSGGGIRARAQPFYVAECLENVVQRIAEDDDVENLLFQIRAYMWSLGPISSREASDFDFLETHTEAFRQIRSGKLVPVKERPSLKDKLRGASATTTKKKQRFARATEDEDE